MLTHIGGEGVVTTIYNGGTLSPTKKGKIAKKAIQSECFQLKEKSTMPAPIKDPPYVLPTTLAKTDTQRIKELKRMLIEGQGEHVVQKVLDIALEDGHPGQMAALKMCMDRALPASLFEKTAAQRSAINITISTLSAPQPIDNSNVIDAEANDG